MPSSIRPVLITTNCFILAVLAWGTVFYGHSVYMNALMTEHDWSASLISSAILVFWLASLPGTLSVGFLVDRYGSPLVIAIGGVSIGSGLCLLGRVDEPWHLFAVYAAMGFGYPALAAAAISATLAPWFDRGFGLSLGIALTGASVGGAMLPPLIVQGATANGFGTTMLFIGSCVLVAVLGVVISTLLIGHPGQTQTQDRRSATTFSMQAILCSGRFWMLALPAAFGLGGQVGFLAHQVPLVAVQTDQVTAALTVTVVAVASAIGRLLVGLASRYLSIVVLTAITYGLHGVGIAMLAGAGSIGQVFGACAAIGLTVGAVVMLPPILVRHFYGTDHFGRTYALVNVVMYVFAGLSPWVVGFLLDSTGSYATGLWVLVALEMLAAILILTALRRPQQAG